MVECVQQEIITNQMRFKSSVFQNLYPLKFINRQIHKLNQKRLNIQMQMREKYFEVDFHDFKLKCTANPALIVFTAQSKLTHEQFAGTYQYEDLPEEIQSNCESVNDLYDFLTTNPKECLEVNSQEFRFKTVSIKKVKWLKVLLQKQTLNQMESLRQRCHQLELENEELKQNHHLSKSEVNCKSLIELSEIIGEKQRVKLRIQKGCKHFRDLQVVENRIRKITNETTLYSFQPKINCNAECYFTIRIHCLQNKQWLIFGLISTQHLQSDFAYCLPGCIAYCGSGGCIFSEMNWEESKIRANENDVVGIAISRKKNEISWILNEKVFWQSRIPKQLEGVELHPYVQLSRAGDQIELNG